MKKRFVFLLLALTGAFSLVSCTPSDQPTNPGDVSESEYKVSISAIGGVKSIKVTKTVKLRATVTNTNEKDVTWSSSDDSIATVDQTGLVTGISTGKVKIRATLNIDANAWAEYEIVVEDVEAPTDITINGISSDNVGWVGETANLEVVVTPTTASSLVTWSSSNSSIASIDENGKLEFLAAGNVVITATSKADNNVKKELNITVKQGYFLTDRGSKNWDFEHQGDTNGYIELSAASDSISAGFNSAYFSGVSSTKFYAEATFNITKLTSNTWDWQGIGIGSGLSDSNSRFFTYSPWCPNTSVNNFNKTILRDRPESWGALTDRSQVWGEHGLNDISLNDDIKIAILRDGDKYYYLINDVLHWYDVNTNYSGINTTPYVVSYDIPVKVSKYFATQDEAKVNEKLALAEYNKTFYAANYGVEYVDDTDFTISNTEKLNKDNKVRSIGDKAMVVRDFEIEFDIDSLSFSYNKTCHRGLTINFTRYDDANTCETISIGKSKEQDTTAIIGRFAKWNYTNSMENDSAVLDWFETSTAIMTNPTQKHHVKIVRKTDLDNEVAYFYLYIDGVKYDFDVNKKGTTSTDAQVKYVGSYLIWVGGEYAAAHISNFVIRSNVNLG